MMKMIFGKLWGLKLKNNIKATPNQNPPPSAGDFRSLIYSQHFSTVVPSC
mgnify:CR=1 FL=1